MIRKAQGWEWGIANYVFYIYQVSIVYKKDSRRIIIIKSTN